MSRARRREGGFSLLELIIALLLSVFVLLGVIMVATMMIKNQMDAVVRGSSVGGSLVSLGSLRKDIQAATYLQCPGSSCPVAFGGYVLSACTNWSQLNSPAGPIDPSLALNPPDPECPGASNVKCFYYCVPYPPVAAPSLMRYVACSTTKINPAPPGYSCGASNAYGPRTIVYSKPGFYRMDGGMDPYFERDDSVSGVGLHFIIGVGTPTVAGSGGGVQQATPVSYKYNLRIGMNKSYNDTAD